MPFKLVRKSLFINQDLKEKMNGENILIFQIDSWICNYNENFIKECNYVVHFAGIGDIVPSIENPKNNMYSAKFCLKIIPLKVGTKLWS